MEEPRKSRLITSFSIDPNEENQSLLKELKMLGVKDGLNFSEILREAIVEYVKRHSPGNPQLILGHWNKEVPMPETIRERTKVEPDPMEGLRALPTDELIRQLAKMERADRRSDLRVSIEMLLQWMIVK